MLLLMYERFDDVELCAEKSALQAGRVDDQQEEDQKALHYEFWMGWADKGRM